MKINKKVLQELISEVRRRQRISGQSYINYKKALRSATSVEEIMKAKQDFMLDIINNLPVIKEDDYFCLLYYGDASGQDYAREQDCSDCPYGKIHGNCHNASSNYDIMYDIICDLRSQVIHKFFKKGEKYD
jgi:hypothetical protein